MEKVCPSNRRIDRSDIKTEYLQIDYANLKHLTRELESALKETKSAYARRIARNIK